MTDKPTETTSADCCDRSDDDVSKRRYMSCEQYKEFDEVGQLPRVWVDSGWHFCLALDGALVNKEDVANFCSCFETPSSDRSITGIAEVKEPQRKNQCQRSEKN